MRGKGTVTENVVGVRRKEMGRDTVTAIMGGHLVQQEEIILTGGVDRLR